MSEPTPREGKGAVSTHGDASLPPVLVKKYANRRLYDTEASTYVTLDDLAKMVRQGRNFVVNDAKSGEDITRTVLTQIIVEEESKGRSLLPESFLRQLIGFYGDSLQSVLPRYLDFAMTGFSRQQEQMRRGVEQAIGGLMPFPPVLGQWEELGKQNMAMMERAMSLFAPFRPGAIPTRPPVEEEPITPAAVEALRREIDTLRQRLRALGETVAEPPKT